MASETVDIGTVSARGQVAIPTEIRNKMRLKEGEKVLFLLEHDTLMLRRLDSLSWTELTRPFKEAAQRAGLREEDVVDTVHRIRKEIRARKTTHE